MPEALTSEAKPSNDSRSVLRDRVRSLRMPSGGNRSPISVTSVLAVIVLAAAIGGVLWLRQLDSLPEGKKGTAAKAGKKSGEAPPPAEQNTSSIPVSTPNAVAENRGGIALEAKGYIIPAHRILVSPKVSGMLTSLNVEEGVRVKKGDVLGTIESVEYEADLKRAEAMLTSARQQLLESQGGRKESIGQAKAELAESQQTLKRFEADFKRLEKLIQTGNVTQSEFDLASFQYQAQKARVDQLTFAVSLSEKPVREEKIAQAAADVLQAEAEVTKTRWRFENCTIRSPVTGTILKKNAEEGNIVNAIAFNGSFSICDIADLSDLEVELNIQERDVAKVFQGQECKVRAEAYPDRVYSGVVSRLMPIADRAKGAIPVRVKVTVPAEEEGVYLKPDMGAIVTFYERTVKG